MKIKLNEIYRELTDLRKEDFNRFIATAKTDDEHNFIKKICEYACNEKVKPKTIYHYMSFSAMEGILY